MKICLIGTGIYGTAIALELAKKKENEIMMWTENAKLYEEFKATKKIKSIIDIELPNNIRITDSYELALKNTKLIFITCASKYVDKVCRDIQPYYKDSPICIATKGIEESTQELLSNIVAKELNTKHIAVISGPTFAIDMINDNPVALALASTNRRTQNLVMKVLMNNHLKLRPTKDIIGIQICGAIKNCIAIAAGILNGLGYAESTQAFLINESIHDIKKIIYYLGGNPKTILSFAGIGDLTMTCSSTKSRNFSFGYTIGSTKNIEKINEYLKANTVEGYYTIEVIYRLLNKKGIDIPLINTIYDIVYNEENPEKLVELLIEKE